MYLNPPAYTRAMWLESCHHLSSRLRRISDVDWPAFVTLLIPEATISILPDARERRDSELRKSGFLNPVSYSRPSQGDAPENP